MSEARARSLQTDPRLPHEAEVIDCTLRDGEQAPGVWFTIEDKLSLATALSRAGIAVLDAGFPGSSASEVEALQAIHDLALPSRIAATARPIVADIKAAARARADEVFLFMPTSDFRLEETLGLTRSKAIDAFRAGAEEVAAFGMTLNIVFEDATRAELYHLISVAESLRRRVPVARLILADTVACAKPATMQRLVEDVISALDHAVVVCSHAHNDFGLATANTLAAVAGGARAITCTVNALGERAGNADLAECVAALTHLYQVDHGVDPLALQALSIMVEQLSGIHTSPNKAVTGFNVFRHESGVHVDGMIKDSRSYEFLPSSWVGRRSEFVLGKHSGAALIRHLLDAEGEKYDDELVRDGVDAVKAWVMQRDKKLHRLAYAARDSFIHSALSGYDPEMLVAGLKRGETPGIRSVE
jgi:isopropylmalate/homocitrate/citramalate synthase